MHLKVKEVIKQITGHDVVDEQQGKAALISFITQEGVGDLIVDRDDLKLLVEIAAIYSHIEDSELLTPQFYTALAGIQGAYIRKKSILQRSDDQELKDAQKACTLITDLYPHLIWSLSEKTDKLICCFHSGITGVPLFSLMDWAYLEEVPSELSVSVRFSPNAISEEKKDELVPSKYLDERFQWKQHSSRRENYLYCKYLSISQLIDLFALNPEIIRVNDVH